MSYQNDPTLMVAPLSEEEKLRRAKRSALGLKLMALGAFIGFLSFVLSICNVCPEYISFVLYGLTTVGVAIAFAGIYCVFE